MTNQQDGATTGLPAKREEMTGAPNGRQNCAGCGKPISDRYMLRALDLLWHEDCLKCGCCDCRLGEVGSSLYTKANLILCKRDYLRLFGSTGYCSACNKVIPAFEMVMRARNNVYHLECFACQQCNHRFCVGDKFYLCDNKILCEYDYEERLVFASMTFNPTAIAHIKRSTSHLPCPTTTASGLTPNLPPQQQQQHQQQQLQHQQQQQLQHQQRAAAGLSQYGQPAAPQPPPPPPPPPPGTAALGAQPSEVTSLSSGYDSPDSPLLDK